VEDRRDRQTFRWCHQLYDNAELLELNLAQPVLTVPLGTHQPTQPSSSAGKRCPCSFVSALVLGTTDHSEETRRTAKHGFFFTLSGSFFHSLDPRPPDKEGVREAAVRKLHGSQQQ